MSPGGSSMVERALALHRDEPSPALPLHVPIDGLMDDAYCEQLGDMLRAMSTGWMSKAATKTLWRQLPNEPGLYMFVWSPRLEFPLERTPDAPAQLRWVLYVGKTGDTTQMTLRLRYKGGYAKYLERDPEDLWNSDEPTDRRGRLDRYLRLHPLEYWYVAIQDRSKIGPLEKRLVKLLNPPVNRSGRGHLQAGPPVKAF